MKACPYILMIALLALTGCRMYGQGTAELVAESVLASAAQIARESDDIWEEARRLVNAAASDSTLTRFADRMQGIADRHASLVMHNASLAERVTAIRNNPLTEWVGRDRYRYLHRALGAMTSQREDLLDQRVTLARDLSTHLGIPAHRQPPEQARYQIRPHYYNTIDAPDLADLLVRLGQ